MRGDLYKGKGALDLPLSSRGQTRTNSGLPAERTTGRGRRQTLLLQSNETQRYASGDHSRRVCSFPSGHPGTEIRGQHAAPWADPIQQILEQCRGAGSSARKTRIVPILGSSDSIRATITISGIEWRKRSKKLNSRSECWRGDRSHSAGHRRLWRPDQVDCTHNLKCISTIGICTRAAETAPVGTVVNPVFAPTRNKRRPEKKSKTSFATRAAV